MKQTINKLTRFLTIICLLFATLSTVFITPLSVRADVSAAATNDFDKSDPVADLSSDENFDIVNYPFNENGNLSIASFNEYCYSFYSEKNAHFALYIYVYNPAALNIVDSALNRIQMAVGYDGEEKPNDFEKFELKFCSVSSGIYARLFYKFRVIDHATNGLSIYDRLNANRRRYDISGIELLSGGTVNATESNVARTYYFTGFAQGYGSDFSAQGSTLKCEYENLETVTLDVKHTYWRSQTSNKGTGYQNQIDTVYFSIPNRLLRDYGRLQRIKAEWYEYLTKDIVVTSNQDFYNNIKNYVGTPVNQDITRWVLYENYQAANPTVISETADTATWSFNREDSAFFKSQKNIDTLYYLFPTKNWVDIEQYDPYSTAETIGGVSCSDLYSYIINYNKSFETGKIKDGLISADLFESDIEDYRKVDNEYGKIQYGYSYYDFDVDVDLFDLSAYKPTEHTLAENIIMYGFWAAIFGSDNTIEESFTDVSPILLLNKMDYLSGTDQEISDRLLLNYNDVNIIKAEVQNANENDETVVLFRFAVSDYYCAGIDIGEIGGGFLGVFDSKISGQAYRAKESIFLDFDIIQLTFNDEGEYTVVPVISRPIDLVDEVTTPYVVKKSNSISAWIIFVLSCVIVAAILLLVIRGYCLTIKSDLHVVFKFIVLILLIVAVGVMMCFGVPYVLNIISELGGL